MHFFISINLDRSMQVLDFTRFSAGFLALNSCVLITTSNSPGCASMDRMLKVSI